MSSKSFRPLITVSNSTDDVQSRAWPNSHIVLEYHPLAPPGQRRVELCIAFSLMVIFDTTPPVYRILSHFILEERRQISLDMHRLSPFRSSEPCFDVPLSCSKLTPSHQLIALLNSAIILL